jgi:hypothetical protein
MRRQSLRRLKKRAMMSRSAYLPRGPVLELAIALGRNERICPIKQAYARTVSSPGRQQLGRPPIGMRDEIVEALVHGLAGR